MFAPISTLSYTSFSILSGVTFVFWLCSTFFLAFLSSERNLQFVYRRTILRAYEKSYVIRGRVHQTQTGHTRIIEQLGMSCTSIFLFHCQSRPQNKKYKQLAITAYKEGTKYNIYINNIKDFIEEILITSKSFNTNKIGIRSSYYVQRTGFSINTSIAKGMTFKKILYLETINGMNKY